MKETERIRLELMGIGSSRPTARQLRLRTLIMARPLLRRFGRRPDVRKLEQLQERMFEHRVRFVATNDDVELRRLAADMIQIDALLGRSQCTEDLKNPDMGRSAA